MILQGKKEFSEIILKTIDILIMKNPERTGYGVLLGVVLLFFSKLFSPYLKQIEIIDIEMAPIWGWIPLGVIMTHFPSVIWSLFHKSKIDDNIDSIIKAIEKGNLSEIEKRHLYRKVITKCMEDVVLKSNISKQHESIKNSLLD